MLSTDALVVLGTQTVAIIFAAGTMLATVRQHGKELDANTHEHEIFRSEIVRLSGLHPAVAWDQHERRAPPEGTDP